jgi:hypothetical protein
MSTVAAKKPTARRKPTRLATKTKTAASLAPKLTPLPAPTGTTKDLLTSLKDGSFAAAAAKCDWAIVERAVKSRRSSRHLRAA